MPTIVFRIISFVFILTIAICPSHLASQSDSNCRPISSFTNPGYCNDANIDCILMIDQAFVDSFGGNIMLARMSAENYFDDARNHLEELLHLQGHEFTFNLNHFTDQIAPNSWYNSSFPTWFGNVYNYFGSSDKKCIKHDVVILLTAQPTAPFGWTNGSRDVVCDPNWSSFQVEHGPGQIIVKKSSRTAKSIAHELLHALGNNHINESGSSATTCDHLCYESTTTPLMCDSGGDWALTSCDNICIQRFLNETMCDCVKRSFPAFDNDFICPANSVTAFSLAADNLNPVLNCKTNGDIVTITATLVNDNSTSERNIVAFIRDEDSQFAEFIQDSTSEFNCITHINSRTEFRITFPVCSNQIFFPLGSGETKTVTLKVKYRGGIDFNMGYPSFPIYFYTGTSVSGDNSIWLTPFVLKEGGTSGTYWDLNNPVIVNGNLTVNTALEFGIGLDAEITNKLLFKSGAGMEIASNGSVKMMHTQIEGCDDMWKGITVKQGGSLEMNTMSSVKDAQYAVNVQKGGTFKATDCMFFNNNYAVRTAPEGAGNYNLTLLGNQFGTDDSGLKTPYSGQSPAPFGNRGYAGIYLADAGSIVLQNSSAQIENKFLTLHNGIIALNTNLSVKNSFFENIEKIPGAPGIPGGLFSTSGKAIYCNGGSLSVTGVGILADSPETFKNCHTGIESFQSSLTVTENKMRSVSIGILSRVGINKNVSITFNDIQGKDLGIGVYHSSALANGCLVNNNSITMNGNVHGIGISTGGSGDFVQSQGLFSNNNVTISDGLAGFQVGVSRNLKVTQNTVFTGNSPTIYGIGISGGDLNTINCNNISGSGERGIYGLMAGRSAFICNTALNTYLGLHFDGVFTGKGTIPVAGNTMTNNYGGGLFMGADAVIGGQVHRGNKWTSTGGTTFAQHLGGNLLAAQSLFTVDANENSTFLPGFINPPGWFVNISTAPLSYQCIPGTSCPLISAAPDPVKDKELAKGELTGLAHQAAQLWLAQQRLFERLTDDGNPYPEDRDIATFLSNAQTNGLKGYGDLQTGLRQIFNLSTTDLADLTLYETQIAQNMDLLAQKEVLLNSYGISQTDSTNLAGERNTLLQTLTTITTQRDSKLNSIASTRSSAAATLLTQNNALSGSADYLLNQKTVNGIFLQTLASGNGYLSAAQMSSLQSTAGQCPLSGGEAVLIARDMLALINEAPVFYNDDVSCNAAPRTLVKAGSIENGLGNIISIFPNPASDEVTIQYDLQNKGISRLQFFNIYGQLVREILLPDSKGKVSTSTSTLESGIYIYTLDGVTAGRLIINR